MNKHSLSRCQWLLCATICLFTYMTAPMVSAQEAPQPVLVTNAPANGTFYLMQGEKSPPYPFDPYFGLLPVYSYDNVFFVDNTQFLQEFQFGEGGEMMLMAGAPSPGGGIVCSNCVPTFCSSLTNFVVSYQSSTDDLLLGIAQTTNPWIALTIFTTNTSSPFDLYGTTNMNSLALPLLGRTHWTRLLQASNTTLSFGWGTTNWCQRYFQLGKTNDLDGDGLTTAFESLVSHTGTNTWDTDGDGLSDGWEVENGLNPLLDESGQPTLRFNYTYDGAGRLKQVSGVQGKIVGIDAEGNILQLTH